MEDKRRTIISFLIGMFIGRYGVPIFIHISYISVIGLLVLKIVAK